jgi:hypothetical protein
MEGWMKCKYTDKHASLEGNSSDEHGKSVELALIQDYNRHRT